MTPSQWFVFITMVTTSDQWLAVVSMTNGFDLLPGLKEPLQIGSFYLENKCDDIYSVKHSKQTCACQIKVSSYSV